MNFHGLGLWIDAMLREHAQGKIHSELMRGAMEVAEALRCAWQKLGDRRAESRYEQVASDSIATPPRQVNWSPTTLAALPPSIDVAKRFRGLLSSRCESCGMVRFHGELALKRQDDPGTCEERRANIYADSADFGAELRWKVGACPTTGGGHCWERVVTPDWLATAHKEWWSGECGEGVWETAARGPEAEDGPKGASSSSGSSTGRGR